MLIISFNDSFLPFFSFSPAKEGYGGINCETLSPCSNQPCLNSGQCINYGPADYKCVCIDMFTGKNCETGMLSFWE